MAQFWLVEERVSGWGAEKGNEMGEHSGQLSGEPGEAGSGGV